MPEVNWCLELVRFGSAVVFCIISHSGTLTKLSDRLSSSCGYISSGSHSRQGKPDKADSICVRAIEIQEKALGPDHPDLVLFLASRATLLQRQVHPPLRLTYS